MPRLGATELPRDGTRWKLFTWGNPATLLIQNGIFTAAYSGKGLKHEGGQPLQPGQNGRRSIEQGPVPEIAAGTGHHGRPRRLGVGKDPNQPAAVLELSEKSMRRDLGRPVEEDHVVRRAGRVALGHRSVPDRDTCVAELAENGAGLLGQRRIALRG